MTIKKLLTMIAGFVVVFGMSQNGLSQSDITQPGDTIVASSSNSPGSEGVANVIDNQPTKYLNFDKIDTGFTVTPAIGLTIVSGLTVQSANDAPDRDPTSYKLEGSNDGTNFTLISEGDIPAFTARFETASISFENSAVYKHYRLTFPTIFNADAANSMQVAEVELIGVQGPTDITQPGDALIASSSNSPGSEGVANVIDNQPTKYLNFDKVDTGFTVTPSVGGTVVTGLSVQSANDAPERDPATYTLEGSLDGSTFFLISEGTVPAFSARFETQYVFFANSRAYASYRVTFPTVGNVDTANSMQVAEVELLGSVAELPQDVTQPGDTLVATSSNSPGSEGVANAIDNQPTKYLNFDKVNTGLTVTPSTGLTIVSGITLQSANDAPDRDPASYTLEGTNDGETFTMISEGAVAPFSARFEKQTILFSNATPYTTYRLIFPTVANVDGANSMQIAEIELLGVAGPQDVTQPGDALIASSSNSPGSEGVANVIDNQPTKYLNFDKVNTGFTVTPQVGETIVTGLSIQSANDAPDRDPATYTLEGSNDDGATFALISEGTIPAFTARFQTKFVFFVANTKAYKTYRVTFPTVANVDGANSMQVAEVELLGVVPGGGPKTEVTSGLIRRQPVDALALEGFGAEFRLIATGPWKVQWFVKDSETGEFTPVSGATTPSYTTPALSAENTGMVYRAEVSSPREVQISNEVTASLFVPSANRSIGLNWIGGGANGAPTEMFAEDIAGFHPQAYWNNLTGSTGDLFSSLFDPDDTDEITPVAVDSNNDVIEDITVDFAASGTWGTGTGEADATERLLNGMATVTTGTRPVSPTLRFSNVPEGQHSLILYMVQRPLEFFGLNIDVVVTDSNGDEVITSRFARPQNSDEYNPAPGYVLITADTAAARSIGNMVRFDNINPGEFQEIQVFMWQPGTSGNPGFNGAQLILDTGDVPVPPSIVTQPASLNGYVGGGRVLSVEVSGENTQIQWFKDGQVIPGATGTTLDLGSLTANSAGRYTVAVSNEGGRVVSKPAVVGVLDENDLQSGLTTHIKFDTNGGDSGLELVGGASIVGSGLIGGAMELDGNEAYGFLPEFEQPEEAMTLSIWARTDNESDRQWGPLVRSWIGSRAIGSRGMFNFNVFEQFDDEGNTFAQPIAAIGVGPNTPSAIGFTPVDTEANVWHHYAFTANGNQLTLYFDGVAVGVIDYLGNLNQSAFGWMAIGAALAETVTEEETTLGLDTAAFPNVWFGHIDDLALWNRSLGSDEVSAIYEAGKAGTAADAVASPLPEGPVIVNKSIGISQTAGNLVITFEGGALLSAPALGTPFQPVAGATSPYTVPTTQNAEFFIVQ